MAKSSVELIGDSNAYCFEIDQAALDMKVSNRDKGNNHAEHYRMNNPYQTIFRKLRKTN